MGFVSDFTGILISLMGHFITAHPSQRQTDVKLFFASDKFIH